MLDLENLHKMIVDRFNRIVNEYPNEAQLESLMRERYYWDGYIRALVDAGHINHNNKLVTHVLRKYYEAQRKIESS